MEQFVNKLLVISMLLSVHLLQPTTWKIFLLTCQQTTGTAVNTLRSKDAHTQIRHG